MRNRRRDSDHQCLYLSNERTDIQSTVRFSVYKTERSNSVGDATIAANTEVASRAQKTTVFEVRDSNDERERAVGQETGSLHRL